MAGVRPSISQVGGTAGECVTLEMPDQRLPREPGRGKSGIIHGVTMGEHDG